MAFLHRVCPETPKENSISLVNMACVQWCFGRASKELLLLLFLCVLGPSMAIVRDDASYYNYELLSNVKSTLDYNPTRISFVLEYDDSGLVRRRRMSSEAEKTIDSKQMKQSQLAKEASLNATVTDDDVTYSTTANEAVSTMTTLELSTETTTLQGVTTTQGTQATTTNAIKVVSPSMNSSTGHPISVVTETPTFKKTMDLKNETRSEQKNQTDITELTTMKGSESTDTKLDDDDELPAINTDGSIPPKTLLQNNITKTQEDEHQYYNSTFIVDEAIAKKYWVDLDNHPELQVNDLLSKSHRRAATVKLKFDFPFYGHKVRNITIATGGFLYTGDYVHNWLAATQYIAPLMANFDTRLSNESYVKYADNGTSFTVEWEKVVLQDKEDEGAFTFQVTLFQNGDIVFVYSVIPFILDQMKEAAHPVKVGLSDAYIMDRTVFFVRRKTIYEYHRVNFNRQGIMNWTVIYLRALPTCLEMSNCSDCLTKDTKFECKWCAELNQCSTGTFRSRQDWLLKGCEKRNIKEINKCPAASTTYKQYVENLDEDGSSFSDEDTNPADESALKKKPGSSPLEHPRDNVNMSVSGIIGILLVVTLIGGLGAWATYAYRNPHSASGQMLIRYRPSQWSWRRGEARYTAATIHM